VLGEIETHGAWRKQRRFPNSRQSAAADRHARHGPDDRVGSLARRLSNKGICGRLFRSPKTVETHVNSIFLKLRLMPAPDDHRRVLAVLAFLKS
jgi:ATP/maltotriose-dependent transcriptional regulator MalT